MNRVKFSWGIREKLTLLFFGVTFIAVFTNFLIVVPRLDAQLRGNQISEMRRLANQYEPLLQLYQNNYDNLLTSPNAAQQYLNNLSVNNPQLSGIRIAILKSSGDPNPLAPQLRALADASGTYRYNQPLSDRIASHAMMTGQAASGAVQVGERTHAEAAVPIHSGDGSSVLGVAVFSESLARVNAVVEQQVRRNLIAGALAMAISLLVGIVASSFIARRIRRLEHAARLVAEGNFTEPLPVDSKDEIGQLARAFNNMQDRLGRADRARKAFIANASHELRTPLFSLGGYVELLREEDLDPQTQREFLDTMHEQIERLTSLATDLLDLSRIDTESLEIAPEQVDVAELVRGVTREFAVRAAHCRAELRVTGDAGAEAYCDPNRVAQIVRILIDNALRHTPSGTAVEVAVVERNGVVSVSVGDDGAGIAAEELPRIFERFHTGSKSGGTGLGLSIANELATAMNSELSVQSGLEGTTFTLRLPLMAGGR